MDDYEARWLLMARGWTVQPITAWPECEAIPGIAWLAKGEWDTDGAPWELWERGFDGFLPPIPDEVLATLPG